MSVIYLNQLELPKVLAAHEKHLPKAIAQGIRLAAHRSRTLLMRKSPVDQAQYKNSWRVKENGGSAGPSLVNDSPIAGVIELGARPHGVSKEGQAAIHAWVMRKLVSKSGKLKGPDRKGPKAPKAVKYGPAAPMAYGPKKSMMGGSAAIQAALGKARAQDAAMRRAKNLKDADKEAWGIVFLICRKLAKHGQQGLFIVRDSMEEMTKFLRLEVSREVAKALSKKGY